MFAALIDLLLKNPILLRIFGEKFTRSLSFSSSIMLISISCGVFFRRILRLELLVKDDADYSELSITITAFFLTTTASIFFDDFLLRLIFDSNFFGD